MIAVAETVRRPCCNRRSSLGTPQYSETRIERGKPNWPRRHGMAASTEMFMQVRISRCRSTTSLTGCQVPVRVSKHLTRVFDGFVCVISDDL